MPTRNTKFYSLLLLLSDAAVLMAAFTIAYIVRVQLDDRPLLADVYAVDFAWAALTIVPFWLLIFAMFGLSHNESNKRHCVTTQPPRQRGQPWHLGTFLLI